MKIIKRKRILISLISIVILVLLLTYLSKPTITIAATDEADILVTGQILDNNSTPIEGVEVFFVPSDGSTQYRLVTDSNGEYVGNVKEGSYKVGINKSNYETKDMKLTQFERNEKLDVNLELAFIYPNQTEFTDKLKCFKNNLIYENPELIFKIIKKTYDDPTKISDVADTIPRITENDDPDAYFLQDGYIGYNGKTSKLYAIIFKEDGDVFNPPTLFNSTSFSKYSILKKNALVQEIINTLYGEEMLKADKSLENSAILSTTDANQSIEIDINSTTILNAQIKQIVSNPIPPTTGSSNFITGSIYKYSVDESNVVYSNMFSPIKVSLKNAINGHEVSYTTTTDGKYNLPFPGPGKYKLEFKFGKSSKINLQYYKPDNTVIDIGPDNTDTKNCLRLTTGASNKSKEYASDYIDKFEESDLDNLEPQGNMIGETNEFVIKPLEPDSDGDGIPEYDPNDHPIIANVVLQQRDKFSLTVEQNVSRYKIVLNNGQVFKSYSYDENNADHKQHRDLRLFNITMDPKLSYGAKLYIEYEIKVKNNSGIKCTGYKLLSTFENLDYNPNNTLLKDGSKNSEQRLGNNYKGCCG